MNRVEQYSGTVALFIVIGTFATSALIAAAGRVPEPVMAPTPALSYIMVIATAQPTAQPTPDAQLLQEVAELRARVAELEAERSPPAAEPQVILMAAPQAAPTVPPAPPPTAEPVQLQTLSIPEGEEPLTDAQMREAQDQ